MKKADKNKLYFTKTCSFLKAREEFSFIDKNGTLNRTEFRLLGEIMLAKCEGRHLISTQLATRLGITRSAVSQMIQKLEADGLLCRLPVDGDKKKSYVDITSEMIEKYKDEWQKSVQFLGDTIEEFGEERFFAMCDLFDEFSALTKKRVQRVKEKA